MATRAAYNKNNAAVKRILQEARELANDSSTEYHAAPLEDNIFDWHCTLRGPKDTEFEGGLYHCRILLPAEYPFRPPSLMVLTPNGRFELNTKICISFTNYHEELWQPAWGIRTAIIALQGFFPQAGEAANGVGALRMPVAERKRLAALSRGWRCPHCEKTNVEILPDPSSSTPEDGHAKSSTDSAIPSATTEATRSLTPSIAQQQQEDRTAPEPAPVARRPAHTIPTILSAAAALPVQGGAAAPHAEAVPAAGPTPVAPMRIYEQPVTPGGGFDDVPHPYAFEAYPTTYSGQNGVPVWLDGSIMALSMFAAGILLHLLFF